MGLPEATSKKERTLVWLRTPPEPKKIALIVATARTHCTHSRKFDERGPSVAREEADREDLMAEATALVRRLEIMVASPASLKSDSDGTAETEPITAGFRRDGAFSIYFGQNLAYHFDPAARLKRAYVAGKLYRTQAGRHAASQPLTGEGQLAELTRVRTTAETVLQRRDLPATECEAFLDSAAGRLVQLQKVLETGEFHLLRSVPTGGTAIVDELRAMLTRLIVPRPASGQSTLQLAPRFPGKR